jgi:hypothetical protein
VDNIFLATSANSTSGSPSSSIQFNGSLAANATYSDTTQLFVPNTYNGNYVVAMRTNANNNQFELNGSNNNIISSSLIVIPQQPCDLNVSAITTPAAVQIAGQQISLQWQVQNNGSNAANGFFRDAIYLSADTIFNAATDILLGTAEGTSNIIPGQNISRQLTAALNNVVTGQYYVIVRTDVLNNLSESNENNNTSISADPIVIEVKQLQMAIPANDSLFNNRALYYRITITAAQANETMSLKLFGDSLKNAVSRLYLKYGQVPAANNYDFAATIPFKANQEIVVPTLQAGIYYIMALGNDTSALQRQLVTLQANIIPFSVTGVNADKGGNTGNVTVRINGAKFASDHLYRLIKSDTILNAIRIIYLNSTTVFATFNLSGAALGIYSVNVKRSSGDSTTLPNSFQVVAGSSGGTGGSNNFTCSIQNIGFEDNLETDALYPASTRINRIVSITIVYANNGNVDIQLPKRYLVSLGGAPVSFNTDFNEALKKLLLEFKEAGGPPDVLRAGASGFIKMYSKAVAPLSFIITE